MNLNSNVVAEILQKTPTAESFASYAAVRARNAREGVSKLPGIRQQMIKAGYHPVPEDLLLMFRELERAGIGTLKGDQFKWNVSIKQIADLAEETSVIKTKSQPKPEPKPGNTSKGLRTLAMYFDGTKEIEIKFSPDLTGDEVKLVMEKLLQNL